jgi:hypothetical protein
MAYVLKLKDADESKTLTMNGIVTGGPYFGGADFEDMWFAATPATAVRYESVEKARSDAKRFGIPGIRDFVPVEVP